MTSKIEDLYQQIGQAAETLATDRAGKILIYAEVEDGVISADAFYPNRAGVVRYRFCPSALRELVYSFWEQWQQEPGNAEWRVMSYVIEGGKFSIDLAYPDQIDPNEDISERRPRAVTKHFGDMRVDYSDPR